MNKSTMVSILALEDTMMRMRLKNAINLIVKTDKLFLKGGDKSMNKTYILQATILVKAKSLESARKKLEPLTQKKAFKLVESFRDTYFKYMGAVKR